ncbi:hypothetical protein [Aequorivita antarctica]|uniref:Gliding motility-associated protein GldM N-terminal domain-containing protein n=1 Tax=Aequorivita antarctica TaxID=153266 RepID=A0A5C6Z4A2_9FLAO|nr:hypothetical protein [Aequorivita antarctica]TXD74985.1 hypothetical protein ESU54_01990 [Aequorivita antarctica]
MKRIILIFTLIIISCKPNNDKANQKDRNQTYAMYGIMVGKYSSSSEFIQNEIYSTVNKFDLVENREARIYDSLTVQYYKYLEKVFYQIEEVTTLDLPGDYIGELSNKKHINNLFFMKSDYSNLGIEYLSKREEYKIQILKLVKDSSLAFRISKFLSTDNETVRDGDEISHLDFYFKDLPPISVMAYLKYNQYSILEFENEFIKNQLINN